MLVAAPNSKDFDGRLYLEIDDEVEVLKKSDGLVVTYVKYIDSLFPDFESLINGAKLDNSRKEKILECRVELNKYDGMAKKYLLGCLIKLIIPENKKIC